MQTLIVDNYDSYTFNLYQLISEVNGTPPWVIQNDQMSWQALKQLAFDNIVISRGPGRPEASKDFGVCRSILKNTHVPVLGVCLGHQGLGQVYGGRVIYAPEVCHGRRSHIYHHSLDLFKGMPSPFVVVRYHSLLVADDLPDCLEKTAWTEDGLVYTQKIDRYPDSERLFVHLFSESTTTFWLDSSRVESDRGASF